MEVERHRLEELFCTHAAAVRAYALRRTDAATTEASRDAAGPDAWQGGRRRRGGAAGSAALAIVSST